MASATLSEPEQIELRVVADHALEIQPQGRQHRLGDGPDLLLHIVLAIPGMAPTTVRAKALTRAGLLAYAQGDRRALKNLLSREVYEGFEAAIRQRETRGEATETRFVSIDKADIAGAEVRGHTAHVTVRFVSQLVSVTQDRSGAVNDLLLETQTAYWGLVTARESARVLAEGPPTAP